MQSLITAVFYKTVIGGFKNRGTVSSNRGFFIRRLLAVSKTAVQPVITAVFDIAVVGGFKNRSVLGNYRGLRYSEY